MFIDNSILPDRNILKNSCYSSKAVVKLLIDSGANTELKFDKIKAKDGSLKSGNYDLKDYWESYGRDDLAELL